MYHSRLRPILALDSESNEADLKQIAAIPGAMLEASVGRFPEYGQPLNEADVDRYREIVQQSGLPVIAPSQKRFTATDVPKLRDAGIGALLLGIIVTGLDPAGLRAAVEPIVLAAKSR
jgi:hypothetical protein